VGVLLALGAALSYGLADFVGGVASKRAGAWAVALVAQVGGGVVLLAGGLVLPGDPSAADLRWAVAAGVANGFGTAFLYRGLAGGRMGVVAPVSGVGAALVPVAVGVLSGERPSAMVWAGIALALPGIWLVSREPVDEGGTRVSTAEGVLDGVLAGLGFGSLFAVLAQIDEGAGLLPLALNQAVAGVAVVAVATALGGAWLPRDPWALLGTVSGVLGGAATLAFLVASNQAYLSVTAVLASLYPAFTVLLAATVLREHVHRAQGLGLLLCGAAVTLVALG
jgi:drug/metabolite transporter (DMT)-like permease